MLTDARIKQKEKLNNDKGAGITPKKIPKHVEDGEDDCGDDFSGLGKDAALLQQDVRPEEDTDSDDEGFWLDIYHTDYEKHADIFSIVTSLCYGKNGYQDLLELHRGNGGTEVAVSRGLSSASNLDKATTYVDLDDPKVQKVIMHFRDTCYVLVVVMEPNCRSTRPPSYPAACGKSRHRASPAYSAALVRGGTGGRTREG